MSTQRSFLFRYGVSTLGLVLAAFGVGLSIKSNLGIAPFSCLPTVLGLEFPQISVGTFTWAFNLLFIVIQAAILGKESRWNILLQVLPLIVFSLLIDLSIFLLNAFEAPVTNYLMQIVLCLIAIVLTAIGIHLEIAGGGWVLPGDNTLNVISTKWNIRYGNVKVSLDVILVAITVVLSLVFFGNWAGNGSTFIIREGTLIQAILTGICMRFTDPLVDRLLEKV